MPTFIKHKIIGINFFNGYRGGSKQHFFYVWRNFAPPFHPIDLYTQKKKRSAKTAPQRRRFCPQNRPLCGTILVPLRHHFFSFLEKNGSSLQKSSSEAPFWLHFFLSVYHYKPTGGPPRYFSRKTNLKATLKEKIQTAATLIKNLMRDLSAEGGNWIFFWWSLIHCKHFGLIKVTRCWSHTGVLINVAQCWLNSIDQDWTTLINTSIYHRINIDQPSITFD